MQYDAREDGKLRPLTQLLSEVYVHSNIVEHLDPTFYSATKLKEPAPVRIRVGQFRWEAAAAATGTTAAAAAAGGAGAATAAAAAAASGVECFNMKEVQWEANAAPRLLFPDVEPMEVMLNGKVVARQVLAQMQHDALYCHTCNRQPRFPVVGL